MQQVRIIITNVQMYKTIAEEAYSQMVLADDSAQTPNSEGTGYIIRYDPERSSFKYAMIALVFTGMWLEALIHLHFVQKHGKELYNKYDRKSYEEKLKKLEVTDEELLDRVRRYRDVRRELVHEKAYFNQEGVKRAQEEAKVAHEMMLKIDEHFLNTN